MKKPTVLLALALSVTPICAAASGTAVAHAAAPTRAHTPDISANGRFVSFSSDTKLVAGDTNRTRDVYVWDVTTAAVRRVSVTSAGKQANGPSFFPSISADGRYVAFLSHASNLVSGDTNGVVDAFRADLRTGKVIRVSVGAGGGQAKGAAADAQIDSSGRYVAFGSTAANLVAGDTNKVADAFVRDVVSGTTQRVSFKPGGGQLTAGGLGKISISPGASRVGFAAGSQQTGYEWTRSTGRVTVLNRGERIHTTRATAKGTAFVGAWEDACVGSPGYIFDGRGTVRGEADCTEAWIGEAFDVNASSTVMAIGEWWNSDEVIRILDGPFFVDDHDGIYLEDWAVDSLVAPSGLSYGDPLAISADGASVAFVDEDGGLNVWQRDADRTVRLPAAT